MTRSTRRAGRLGTFGDMDKLDQIFATVARIEEKLDHHAETLKGHDKDIDGLKQKWWSRVGLSFLPWGCGSNNSWPHEALQKLSSIVPQPRRATRHDRDNTTVAHKRAA